MQSGDIFRPRYDHLLQVVEEQARLNPDVLAYDYLGQERLTFREVRDQVHALARALIRAGVRPGDHVSIILPTSLKQVLLVYAVVGAGGALVLLDPDAPPKLLARRLRQARVTHVITTAPINAALSAEGLAPISLLVADELACDPEDTAPLPEITPDHTAYLQFTSGTTGDPKVVVIQHRQLMPYLELHTSLEDSTERAIMVSWVPIYHDLGLVGTVLIALYIGGSCYLMPPNIVSLNQWLPTMSRLRATMTMGPDFAYRLVTRTVDPSKVDLSSLRVTGSGGEPLRIETINKFEQRFGLRHTSVGGYGQAESVMCISLGLPGSPPRVDERGNVSNGQPLPGLEVRIVDPSGNALPPGQPGEIVMRGPTIFAGYLDDPEATAQVVRDGWLHTGDVGYRDADGFVFVLGRMKSLIKRGGVTISPREIESAADQVPNVRFSVAVGVPRKNALHSEDLVVLAEVKPEHAATPEARTALGEAIAEAIQTHTGHSPSDIVLLKPRTAPRTPNGKIQHLVLRDLYVNDQLGPLTYAG